MYECIIGIVTSGDNIIGPINTINVFVVRGLTNRN